MDITFTPRDLILAASTIGPVVISLVGFYVKLNQRHAEMRAVNKATSDALDQVSSSIQSLRDELNDTDRDIRGKIGHLHDRVNACESGLAEYRGWREAQK